MGNMLKRTSRVLIVSAFGAAGICGAISAFAAPPSKATVDTDNARYAQAMLDEGRKTFRYETFGSEAFWGDTLQLHKAIAGAKNGGVGPGVSPKTALSVGLKVDADALPDALKQQIKGGKVNLDDPATTIALLSSTLSSVSPPLPTPMAASSRWASSARFVTRPSTTRSRLASVSGSTVGPIAI